MGWIQKIKDFFQKVLKKQEYLPNTEITKEEPISPNKENFQKSLLKENFVNEEMEDLNRKLISGQITWEEIETSVKERLNEYYDKKIEYLEREISIRKKEISNLKLKLS